MEAQVLLDKYFETAFSAPDGVKKLRELILSLAMQGKLVPQDPSDQPASELLKEIEVEKERLIKEGKIKKSKPLPEITSDEIPYDLPESWEWVKLENIVSILGDGIHGTPQYSEKGEFYFINGNNLSDGVIEIKNNTKKVSIEEFNKYKKQLNKNSVLVSINGTIGNIAFYNNEKIILGKSACYFNLLSNINKLYIKKLINSKYFLTYAVNSATGTTIKNVSLKAMREFLVPLPSLAEQYRIVEKINRLMEQCDRLEKLRKEHHQKRLIIHTAARDRLLNAIDQNSLNQSWNFIHDNFGELYSVKENVSELRKIILQLAVMGKLVPQDPSEESALVLFKKIRKNIDELVEQKKEKKIDFENVNNQALIAILPEKWLWVRFGSILNNLKYGTSKKCSYEVNGSAVLRIPNINVETGKIILDDLKYTELSKLELSELSLMPNDLLMIRSNGSETLVGRVAIVTELESDFAYAGYLIRLRFLTQFIYCRYLYFVLNTTFIRKQIERPLRTTSGVKNINSKEIANLLIPLPPLPEQHRIVTKIDQLMKMCDQLEQQIEQSTDKRTKLLNAILSNIQ